MTAYAQTPALSEIAELNPAADAPLGPAETVAFLPMSGVDADLTVASVRETRPYSEVARGYTPFMDADLLVAKITPCFENGKIAQARLGLRYGFGSTEFHVIRPRTNRADGRYLLHFLRQKHVRLAGQRRMTGSAGQRRVPEAFLSKLRVPLPPLREQRRIAAILDKADALRAKRRATLAQVDTLTQSIFLEMFGDPSASGWDTATVAAVASGARGSIRTGPFGSQLLHSEFTDSGIAVLGIDNAVQNEFQWRERRFITQAKYEQLKRYTVSPGDVLITIMGTCGRCAIVPDDIPAAINTKHLCCITLDREKCVPQFLHAYFLHHPLARSYLRRKTKGAIMGGLNMGIIKDMPIPLVPVELQHKFEGWTRQVFRLKASQQSSLTQLDALFASLQHRAFRGEL